MTQEKKTPCLTGLRWKLGTLSDADLQALQDCVEFALPHFADALHDYAEGTTEGTEVRARLQAAQQLADELFK